MPQTLIHLRRSSVPGQRQQMAIEEAKAILHAKRRLMLRSGSRRGQRGKRFQRRCFQTTNDGTA